MKKKHSIFFGSYQMWEILKVATTLPEHEYSSGKQGNMDKI